MFNFVSLFDIVRSNKMTAVEGFTVRVQSKGFAHSDFLGLSRRYFIRYPERPFPRPLMNPIKCIEISLQANGIDSPGK